MDKFIFDSVELPLKVNQIVCLEHQDSTLYGEVIQLIPRRSLCWFRPMCLVISNDRERELSFVQNQTNRLLESKQDQPTNCAEADAGLALEHSRTKSDQSGYSTVVQEVFFDSLNLKQCKLIDLQATSDLFWPASLFRPAWDTEIIGYTAQLNGIRHHPIDISSNFQYLNKFVHQFWKANQDEF